MMTFLLPPPPPKAEHAAKTVHKTAAAICEVDKNKEVYNYRIEADFIM